MFVVVVVVVVFLFVCFVCLFLFVLFLFVCVGVLFVFCLFVSLFVCFTSTCTRVVGGSCFLFGSSQVVWEEGDDLCASVRI